MRIDAIRRRPHEIELALERNAMPMPMRRAADAAVKSGRARAPSAVSARTVPIAADACANRALATIARECLHQVAANAPGVVAERDPEWVHQMRVGTRRLRACMKLVSRVDASMPVEPVAAELKWLAGVLGTARDLDIFATQTLPQVSQALLADRRVSAALAQLARRIGARRAIARRAARAAVTSARYARCRLATAALIARLEAAAPSQPMAVAASALLARRHRKLHRRAAELVKGSAEQRHAARIAAKKLRYAAEFFAPLHSAKHTRRYLRALADLQHVLGACNDWIGATRLAAQSGPEIAAAAVRAFAAAEADAQTPALKKARKRFERAQPFWNAA